MMPGARTHTHPTTGTEVGTPGTAKRPSEQRTASPAPPPQPLPAALTQRLRPPGVRLFPGGSTFYQGPGRGSHCSSEKWRGGCQGAGLFQRPKRTQERLSPLSPPGSVRVSPLTRPLPGRGGSAGAQLLCVLGKSLTLSESELLISNCGEEGDRHSFTHGFTEHL